MSNVFNNVFGSTTSQAKSKSKLSKRFENTSFTHPKLVWNGEVFGVGRNDMVEMYQLRVPTGMFTKHASNAEGIQVYKVVKLFWKKQVTTVMKETAPDWDTGNAPSTSVVLVVELEDGVYTVVRVNTNKLFTYICSELGFTDIPITYSKKGHEVSNWKEMLTTDTLVTKDLTFKQAIINLFTSWDKALSTDSLKVMFTQSYKAYESQDMIENIIQLREEVDGKYPTVKDNTAALNAFIANNK